MSSGEPSATKPCGRLASRLWDSGSTLVLACGFPFKLFFNIVG